MSLADNEYTIRKAGPHETPIVLALLRNHFFPVEPLFSTYLELNRAAMTEEEVGLINEDLDRFHRALVEREICYVLLKQGSEKIIGAALAKPEERSEVSATMDGADESDSEADPVRLNSRLMSEWFNCVLFATGAVANVFEEFPEASRVLDILILCVDQDYGRRGLASRLIREVIDSARRMEFDMVTGLFTSPYSMRAASKIGFRSYANIDWLSFRDSGGKPLYGGKDSYVFSLMSLKL